MKCLLKVILAGVILSLPLSALAVDCNAHKYKCHKYDGACHAKKRACFATAAPISTYLEGVKGYCANYPGRTRDMQKIIDAKNYLIAKGYNSARDFDGVKIRWCNIGGYRGGGTNIGGIGLVVKKDHVLLDESQRASSRLKLAKLLAHEIYHVNQRRGWGYV